MHLTLDLFYAAIGFLWLTELWIRFREKGSVQAGKDKNSKNILYLSVAIAFGIGILLSDKTTYPILVNKQIAYLLGAIIIFAGVTFRILAVTTLGNFFRTTVMTVEKQKVISSGLYKFLRHPSYSGILLALIGAGVGINNWLALFVMFLCTLAGLSYRISVEEQVLLITLGKDYKVYMKRTKRLIPFIY